MINTLGIYESNNAKVYIKMIALGWTSKHILQQAISTVSAYNPSKPRFICLGMAKEVSSYIQEISVLHESLNPQLWTDCYQLCLQQRTRTVITSQVVQTRVNVRTACVPLGSQRFPTQWFRCLLSLTTKSSSILGLLKQTAIKHAEVLQTK